MTPGRKALVFNLSCLSYFTVTVCILYLFLWGVWATDDHKAGMVTGIIIGSFFPFISLRYFYLNYLTDNQESQSILGWVGPSLLLHIIIVFGFLITVSITVNRNHYTSSMFTGFYEYGKIYKSFQEKESLILKDPGGFFAAHTQENGQQMTFTDFKDFYAAYFTDSQTGLTQDQDDPPNQYETYAILAHRINKIPAVIALTFGFLGALIFCLMDALVRMNQSDLYPKTYISYNIRIVVSASIALILSFSIMDDWPIIFSALIFFFIGYFPERAIKYCDEKITKFLGIKTTEYKPTPLTSIQGLSNEKAMRFRDIGIEDVQNLAIGDIDKIAKDTPFSKDILRDWIGQGILILHVPEQFEELRHLGIRTIMDLQECFLEKKQLDATEQQKTKDCSEKFGIKYEHLENLRSILSTDHLKNRIIQLNKESEK